MQEEPTKYSLETVERYVRNLGLPAAVAALLMLGFGFWRLSLPQPSGLFEAGNFILVLTLRVGGIIMALIAIGCLGGQRFWLAIDAVVTISIGVLLAASGLMMIADGGDAFMSLLNIVFGVVFGSAGRRSWGLFVELGDNPQQSRRRLLKNRSYMAESAWEEGAASDDSLTGHLVRTRRGVEVGQPPASEPPPATSAGPPESAPQQPPAPMVRPTTAMPDPSALASAARPAAQPKAESPPPTRAEAHEPPISAPSASHSEAEQRPTQQPESTESAAKHEHEPEPPPAPPEPKSDAPAADADEDESKSDEPAPEGFLAAFGKQQRDKRD